MILLGSLYTKLRADAGIVMNLWVICSTMFCSLDWWQRNEAGCARDSHSHCYLQSRRWSDSCLCRAPHCNGSLLLLQLILAIFLPGELLTSYWIVTLFTIFVIGASKSERDTAPSGRETAPSERDTAPQKVILQPLKWYFKLRKRYRTISKRYCAPRKWYCTLSKKYIALWKRYCALWKRCCAIWIKKYCTPW